MCLGPHKDPFISPFSMLPELDYLSQVRMLTTPTSILYYNLDNPGFLVALLGFSLTLAVLSPVSIYPYIYAAFWVKTSREVQLCV